MPLSVIATGPEHDRRLYRTAIRGLATKISNYDQYLTDTSKRRQPSPIRRLQPLVSLPGMISLGGGLPNPDCFPITSLSFGVKMPTRNEMSISLSDMELNTALQYSPTAGIPKLHSQLMELQRREHGTNDCDKDGTALIVTVESQDGFCKALKMLIGPGDGDVIFLETPTYSRALSFLQPYSSNMVPVPIDERGLVPSKLQSALENDSLINGNSGRQRVLYTIPTAQNPSEATIAQE